ncbi:hypothetical protein GCM10027516_19400 [Niabella aquatica]
MLINEEKNNAVKRNGFVMPICRRAATGYKTAKGRGYMIDTPPFVVCKSCCEIALTPFCLNPLFVS